MTVVCANFIFSFIFFFFFIVVSGTSDCPCSNTSSGLFSWSLTPEVGSLTQDMVSVPNGLLERLNLLTTSSTIYMALFSDDRANAITNKT